MFKRYRLPISCVLLSCSCLSIAGDGVDGVHKAEEAVKYRQSTFELMGWHFKHMGKMIQKRKPFTVEEFRYRASAVMTLASMLDEGFTQDTQSAKAFTLLKPEMWYQRDRFDGYLYDLQESSKALADFAKNIKSDDIDVNTLRSPFGKVARQCKACHDRYKNRK